MFLLRYPYTMEIDEDDKGKDVFYLSCPIVDEPLAIGQTLEEAKVDLLGLILFTASVYRKENRLFPVPTAKNFDSNCVGLNLCQSLKIFLLNAMTETRTRPSDIARYLGLPRQRMTRLLNPRASSRLETLCDAIEATGKRLEIYVS